jgi:hypothetical protein
VSKLNLAGVAALLAAPLTIIAAALVIPTLSDDPGDQVAALIDHRTAMLAGMTLQTIAIALMIGGTIWLAFALASRAPQLASVGGVLAVGGALIVLFIDSVHAAAATVALGVDPAQAIPTVHRIVTSAAVSVLEPLQMLQDLGFVLLGIAAAKAGAPRSAAAAIVIGALGEGAGFAAGSKPLVIAAFAVLLAGLVPTVRALTRASAPLRSRPLETAAA